MRLALISDIHANLEAFNAVIADARLTGEVLTGGNARTGPDGEIWRGKRKEVNYPEVLMSMVYWSHLSGDADIRALANTVYDYALELYKQSRG